VEWEVNSLVNIVETQEPTLGANMMSTLETPLEEEVSPATMKKPLENTISVDKVPSTLRNTEAANPCWADTVLEVLANRASANTVMNLLAKTALVNTVTKGLAKTASANNVMKELVNIVFPLPANDDSPNSTCVEIETSNHIAAHHRTRLASPVRLHMACQKHQALVPQHNHCHTHYTP
jgi:hypothetical protein